MYGRVPADGRHHEQLYHARDLNTKLAALRITAQAHTSASEICEAQDVARRYYSACSANTPCVLMLHEQQNTPPHNTGEDKRKDITVKSRQMSHDHPRGTDDIADEAKALILVT